MNLRNRFLLTGAAISLPLAYVVTSWVGGLRFDDMALTLENVVKLQVNDQNRERCEADPMWFLNGPLEGRPRIGTPKPTDPDVILPRAKKAEHPYELYAYDDQFAGSSTAAPRFPQDMKIALRTGKPYVLQRFSTPDGDGIQMAIATNWSGPCANWFALMRPDPGLRWSQYRLFALSAVLIFIAVFAVTFPVSWRAQRLARAARESVRSEFSVTVPATGHDELTAFGASFNEASAEIRRKVAEVRDREESHRRFVSRVSDELVPVIDELEQQLPSIDKSAAVIQAHRAASTAANLIVAAKLRMRGGLPSMEEVDLGEIVHAAVERHRTMAAAARVAISLTAPKGQVRVVGDGPLYDRAIGNLIENAILYNRSGGHVDVRLASEEPNKFALRVIDDGPGLTDEALTELTAVRRFRGDEGAPSRRKLGLAIVWETAERSQWQMTIRHASGKGLAVELLGRCK